jgi:HlyD family secretion protein
MKSWTLLCATLLLAVAGCGDEPSSTVQGYVEGDYQRIGLPAAGQVVSLAVDRGSVVTAGQELFTLDSDAEQAALAQTQAQLDQATGQRDNLLTGRRVLEIKAMEAQQAQAEASMRLSVVQLRRQEALVVSGYASHEQVDQARSALDRDRARVAELSAQVAFAHEGGRNAEIAAAEAGVRAAQAALAQAQWRLDQRRGLAPQDARVDDVLFRPGEQVAAGQPVVVLLSPGNVKLRFYLAPQQVARAPLGSVIGLACDGCAAGMSAKVNFIASEASYAPPVLYSREGKDKLVFLIEARPGQAAPPLHPGQPVTVSLPPAAGGK